MTDLKTLDHETLYAIWEKCIDNQWPEQIGEKPEEFDELPDKKKWNHLFSKRSKQDYLRPISIAARELMPDDFFFKKGEEAFEKGWGEYYSGKSQSEKIFLLCARSVTKLTASEKMAIREYCTKYPG